MKTNFHNCKTMHKNNFKYVIATDYNIGIELRNGGISHFDLFWRLNKMLVCGECGINPFQESAMIQIPRRKKDEKRVDHSKNLLQLTFFEHLT